MKVDGKLPAGSYWTSNPWADVGNTITQPAGEGVGCCAAPLGNKKGTGSSAEGEYSPMADWSSDDDDCGEYARSVASDDEWEHVESSSSPPVAAVVAEGRFIPPQVAEALQSVTDEESLSHPTVYSTTSITLGAVTRWERGKGRWRLRTRRLSTAAMATPLLLPSFRGEYQRCVLHRRGAERGHIVRNRRA